jgi:hypothetical protein
MMPFGKPGDPPNWRTVFGLPVVIALFSLTGLISALLFDELGRYFSWIGVGSPIIILSRIFFVQRLRRSS